MGIPIGEGILYTLLLVDDQTVVAAEAYDVNFMLLKLKEKLNI